MTTFETSMPTVVLALSNLIATNPEVVSDLIKAAGQSARGRVAGVARWLGGLERY
ncbi:hypothetical protein PanWU01x14_159910 [Parasponia andersonii]|uniref:Uncharacterized protein n=1 Tax=Parasponia andersonii TaxID=3476 RepID=A0A2P5CDV9_PARAD|nr:hypothetical protein PanWU01x14_159910 [Parasponia andersonii]